MKTLLKNAKIYDGTGAEPYVADILTVEDRIVRIAEGMDEAADQVIDLKGKSVSSGFIDGHSHNDWFAIKKEPLPYFRPFILQGITTFVTGNCGISEIGCEKAIRIRTGWVAESSVSGIQPDSTAPRRNTSARWTGTCPAIWQCWRVTAPPGRLPEGLRTGR